MRRREPGSQCQTAIEFGCGPHGACHGSAPTGLAPGSDVYRGRQAGTRTRAAPDRYPLHVMDGVPSLSAACTGTQYWWWCIMIHGRAERGAGAGPGRRRRVANLEWMRPARPRGGAPPRPYSLHPRRAGIWIWPPDSSARLSTRCGAPRARRHWGCRGHRSSRCPAAADHRARRQRVAQLRAPVHAGRLRPPEARAAQHSTAAAAARAAAAMDGDREPLRRVG